MAMDWTPLLSALAGAGVAIMSEAIGRRGARRLAAEERRASSEEQALRHERELRQRRDEFVRQAERDAVSAIISELDANPIGMIDPEGMELSTTDLNRRMARWLSTLYRNSLTVTDVELRRRLELATSILDMMLTPIIDVGLERRQVAAIVRRNIHLWLGSWLRSESFPEPTHDWNELERRNDEWWAQWNDYAVRVGFDGSPHSTTKIHAASVADSD